MLGLGVDVDFSAGPHWRSMRPGFLDQGVAIPVQGWHVRRALERYIAGELTEEELSDWAAFVFMSGAFVPLGDTEEERWLAGEGPLWDVIQRLVSPHVFGGLDRGVAMRYLGMIDAE
jgi:hypothetical protein